MHLVLIAFSCRPNRGSEPGVGWQTAVQLSRYCHVTAITRPEAREDIENAVRSLPNGHSLEFRYHPFPALMRFAAKFHSLGYYTWIHSLRRKLATYVDLDGAIVQHVTFVRYWIACYPGLEAKHFIFGPVGGGEDTPIALRSTLSCFDRISEWTRRFIRGTFERLTVLPDSVEHADLSIGVTGETSARLKSLGARVVKTPPAIALSRDEFDQLRAFGSDSRTETEFVCAGRLISWKAYDIAVRAFAQYVRCGGRGKMVIIGRGPQDRRLRKLVRKLELSDRVKLEGYLPREQVWRRLGRATAFVHPSLHDSGGGTPLEALAAGTPVICLDSGGPGLIVTADCGWKIEPRPAPEVEKEIAAVMIEAEQNPKDCRRSGRAGQQRVEEHFLDERKIEKLVGFYSEIGLTSNTSAEVI